jgi:hypothetical protein
MCEGEMAGAVAFTVVRMRSLVPREPGGLL